MIILINQKQASSCFCLILQANMGFLVSPNGGILHELCYYHNHKTALFFCIFLGPFKLRMGIDPMGMQMKVCSFWCLSLNLSSDTYLQKLLCSKLCSLRPFISHENIQQDDHNTYSSGLLGFDFFLSAVPPWSSPGDLAKREHLKEESGD